MKQVIQEEGARPIKIWTDEVEDSALKQLKNIARLPFIAHNGVACMPDVHAGIGATVGTVIATDKALLALASAYRVQKALEYAKSPEAQKARTEGYDGTY